MEGLAQAPQQALQETNDLTCGPFPVAALPCGACRACPAALGSLISPPARLRWPSEEGLLLEVPRQQSLSVRSSASRLWNCLQAGAHGRSAAKWGSAGPLNQQSTSQAQMLDRCGSTPTCRHTQHWILTAPPGPRWAPDLRCMPDLALCCQKVHRRCETCLKPVTCLAPRHLGVHRPLAADDMLMLPGKEHQADAAGRAAMSASMLCAARLASRQVPPAGKFSVNHFSHTAAAALCHESKLFESLRDLQSCSHGAVQESGCPS